MARIVVILSEMYDGPPVKTTYAFNPATGADLDLKVDLDLSETELELVRSNQALTDESYAAALNSGFDIIYKRSQARHLERETSNAFEHACKSMGIPPDSIIPNERMHEFATLIANHLSSVIAKMVRH
jgi:hypothetical protein